MVLPQKIFGFVLRHGSKRFGFLFALLKCSLITNCLLIMVVVVACCRHFLSPVCWLASKAQLLLYLDPIYLVLYIMLPGNSREIGKTLHTFYTHLYIFRYGFV